MMDYETYLFLNSFSPPGSLKRNEENTCNTAIVAWVVFIHSKFDLLN